MNKLILIAMLIVSLHHTTSTTTRQQSLTQIPMVVEGRATTHHHNLKPHSYKPKLSQRIQKQLVSRRVQQTNKKFQSTCINPQNQRYVICQTRFTFRFPTQSFVQEVVFGRRRNRGLSSSDHLNKSHVSISSMQRMEFNHDCVGRTHPSLQLSCVDSCSMDDKDMLMDELDGASNMPITVASNSRSKTTQSNTHNTILANTKSYPDDPIDQSRTTSNDIKEWFPPSSFFDTQKQQQTINDQTNTSKERRGLLSSIILPSTTKKQTSWRVCRYVKRVGKGEECYNRVRDAALNWEFHTNPNSIKSAADGTSSQHSNICNGEKAMGIIRVRPHQDTTKQEIIDDDGCRMIGSKTLYQDPFAPLSAEQSNIQQLWSKPGAVKLATYTEARPFRNFFSKNTDKGGIRRWLDKLVPSLYAVNPIAVVYDVIDQRGPKETYTCTAYATLMGHLLSGEERVTVVLRDDAGRSMSNPKSVPARTSNIGRSGSKISSTRLHSKSHEMVQCSDSSTNNKLEDTNAQGFVDVEILSYSRAAPSFLGRLIWPLIGGMQDEFFKKQMDAFHQVAGVDINE